MFVIYNDKGTWGAFTRSFLKSFQENLNSITGGSDYYISLVYRIKKLKLPLDLSYFKEPPMRESELIWSN